MARARLPAPAMLVALLAVAMAATAAGAADKSSICDTVKCGKGTCSVVLGAVFEGFNCTCDPGWYQQRLPNNLTADFSPCVIPDCSFSSVCLNLTLPTDMGGIPLLDPCLSINCGQGGTCEGGAGFSYQCRCRPGFKNLLDDTSMPCVGGSCTFGPDCAKLGLVNPPAAPAPAPVLGNDLY